MPASSTQPSSSSPAAAGPAGAPAAAPTAGDESGQAELDRLGGELNACLMSQYVFTVVGLALGTGLGIHRRSMYPLVGFGAAGSLGDLLFGLGTACRPKLDAYRACRDRLQPKPELPPRADLVSFKDRAAAVAEMARPRGGGDGDKK